MNGKNVVILGAGNIGQTIAKVIKKNTRRVELWDKNSAQNPSQKPLREIIPSADFIFFCFPSQGYKETIKTILPFLKKEAIIISLAKGIVKDNLSTIDVLLERNLPYGQTFALLAGPFLAKEINQGLSAFGVVATKNKSSYLSIKKLFVRSSIHLEFSKDLKGVALASSLKNVYALLLGAADGLKIGLNAKGFLVAKTAEEIEEIVKILGGKHETAMGTAGLGDLITTGFSPHSRNRSVGESLIKQKKKSLQSEGCLSVDRVIKMLGRKSKKFPLLLSLSGIIKKPNQARLIVSKFL